MRVAAMENDCPELRMIARSILGVLKAIRLQRFILPLMNAEKR